MSTISVRPLTCLLERGAGLPALQVAVEIAARPDGVRLLLNGATLGSWPASVAHGVARLPMGEEIGPDGVAVHVATLGAGGLVTVLTGGRLLFSSGRAQPGANARRRVVRGLRGARRARAGTGDGVRRVPPTWLCSRRRAGPGGTTSDLSSAPRARP